MAARPTRHRTRESQQPLRQRVIIIGAGGHGRVVLDILLQTGTYDVHGFLDSNPDIRGRRVDGITVLGDNAHAQTLASNGQIDGAIIAIGDNDIRRELARRLERFEIPLIRAIHPSATLALNANIGRNTVIAAGVVVCAHCQIGDSVILNSGCIIDHQTTIAEGCHVCPGVRIAGRVHVESGAFIGIGATIVPNIRIGADAIVGAGAVVTENVPSMATVVGVPARPVKLSTAGEDAAAMLMPAQRTPQDARACQPLAAPR